MNIKELKEMIGLMNDNGLSELEIEKEGMRIRLRKGVSGIIEQSAEILAPKQARAPEQQAPSLEKKNFSEIKAPMVGTFYRAASPDASPYVEAGDTIDAGQVICIIEAMKLMNEIKSEIKGKIVDIAVENGQPIEFGQVLFVVDTQ